MATITKRGDKYRVLVRRLGYPPISKTFSLRRDAETWGKQTEIALERGHADLAVDHREKLKGVTLSKLIDRYAETVTISKKGAEPERYFLAAFQRHPIASKPVANITTGDFAVYRDERLKDVKPQTLKRQLAVIHHLFEIAKDEWLLPIRENPLDKLTLHVVPCRRSRRLMDGELDLLIRDADLRKNPYVKPVILWAVATGMRRGEILAMKWRDIDLHNRVVTIPETKNGSPRRIPLTVQAMEILEGLDPVEDRVFPITENAFKLAWRRLLIATEIQGLRFHDLRHEAISTLFERGLNTPEVASISGHKDWKMLAVYTNPKPELILRKLEASS